MTSWVSLFTIYSSAGHNSLPFFIVDGQCYDFYVVFISSVFNITMRRTNPWIENPS